MLAILLHPLTAVALAVLIVALIAGVIVLYLLMDPHSPPAAGPTARRESAHHDHAATKGYR